MNERLCNVALAVPLRTTFTYKVPVRLARGNSARHPRRRAISQKIPDRCGHRMAEEAPPDTKLRDIQKCLDLVPALTAKLLELGRWIASYYVAPIGEVYRAMFPPVTNFAPNRLLCCQKQAGQPRQLSSMKLKTSRLSAETAIRKRRAAAANRHSLRNFPA